MKWQKCPICEGHGIVPRGFYVYPADQVFCTGETTPEKCQTCNGSGKILEAPEWACTQKEN